MKKFAIWVAAVLAAAAILTALWFGGWGLYRANLAQMRDANHTSQQWQDARVAEVRNYVQAYHAAVSPAQKEQLAATLCAVYKTIDNPPADLAQASAQICN